MSFFDIDQVRGKHIAETVSFKLITEEILPIEKLGLSAVHSVKLLSAVGTAIYKIDDGDVRYVNARLGTPWGGIERAAAGEAAAQYYKETSGAPEIIKLDTAPIEYRGTLPVWQVTYEDSAKTRLYLDASTGELRAVRTRLWRVYDFMWMLHIMDYDGRDDINNWWLWLCSAVASLFAVSGIMLVVQRLFLRPRKPHSKST